MSATLAAARILVLDDEEFYHNQAKEIFEGYNIKIAKSIDEAKQLASNKEFDIFICDLRLEHITNGEPGNNILRYIRKQNKGVFLALYTSYIKDLNSNDILVLKENEISIYEKSDDNELFLLNLRKDFIAFRKKIDPEPTTLEADEPYFELKRQVLIQLSNVSNQEIIIPIQDSKDIPVKDLIIEVEKNTTIGKKYMTEWLKTITLIKKIRGEDKIL